ncbi:hypothetical protein scyTo_0025735, partial [Scyliorhinus torazame]|nr:hypothetical protein [Scyliorhinus torazame]
MSTSGNANDSHLSSSSTEPRAAPASDTDRVKHSSGDRGFPAPGSQAHGSQVPLHHPGWVSRRNDLRVPEPSPDCGASEDRIEGGQLTYASLDAPGTTDAPLQDPRNFPCPQAIPLQPVVQASSHRLVSAATEGHEVNPDAITPGRHGTLASSAAEMLRHERYLQQCAANGADHPDLGGNCVYAEQSQSVMLPLLPNQPSLEDLTQLLNYSFLSHASFHPLELQVDETMLT